MEEKTTYLDDCKTPEEKIQAIIDNLGYLIEFKGYSTSKLDNELFGRNYFSMCKSRGGMDFARLLIYCDKLGVSLSKLMTFSYKGIAKKAEIEAKEARARELEAELAKLRMQLKLDRQEISDIYHEANIKKMEV
ncbi:MAG: hypothetical protein J6U54_11005 [Clostridiales bacterium]|nr:hypothetical protein [Clostridiales bacterium]